MRLLADTQLLLWFALEPRKLGAATADLLSDPANEAWFSAASIWETAIKSSLGRSDFSVDASALASGLVAEGWRELTVTALHAAAVGSLPALHADPFDRILVAQARAEGLALLTRDRTVARYPGNVRLA